MSRKSKRAREETQDLDLAPPVAKLPKTAAVAFIGEASSSNANEDNNKLLEVGEIIPAEARTAVDIQHAITVAPTLLPELGTCPLVERGLLEELSYMDSDTISGWEKQKMQEACVAHQEKVKVLQRIQVEIESMQNPYPIYFKTERGKEAAPKLTTKNCTVTLKIPALQALLGKDVTGESTFKLSDFNEPISKFSEPGALVETVKPTTSSKPTSRAIGKGTSKTAKPLEFDPNSLLRKLYEVGTTSPFGQVKTQKTVVDESVHRARQIDAEHFSVSSELISKIEEIWSKHFYPSSVTAVPYKIKLYDPNGMFQHHKDTPETGLVGTFLVGLTHADNFIRHLHLPKLEERSWQQTYWGSSNGTWCAFYPDVVHSVLKVETDDPCHTRGTIAFKIFAKEPQTPLAVHAKALSVLNETQRPFGILLKHDYTVECKKGLLKGADAALFEVLSRMENCTIRLLPVLTSLFYQAEVEEYRSNDTTYSEVKVYPFNEAMIQACLAPEDDPAGALLAVAQWPDELRNIPFVTTRDWNAKALSHTQDAGAEHTGNESRPAEQHSIYLSAAILVLPN